MSPALQELAALLARLNRGPGGAGLPEAAARRLTEALDRGLPLAQAADGVRLDGRVAKAAEASGAEDLPAALGGLAALAAEVDAGARRLRSAALYPLVLAAVVAIAGGILVGAALPALRLMPGGALQQSGGLLVALLATAAILLVALSGVVLGRLRVPWLSDGWTLLDRYAFVASLEVLLRAGAPLIGAVRGSAAWSRGRARDAAMCLARSLEAGEAPARLAPLLAPYEAVALAGAARTGTVTETVAALTVVRRTSLTRVLPDTVIRVHACALLLGGGALLAVGVTLFQAYSRAVLG